MKKVLSLLLSLLLSVGICSTCVYASDPTEPCAYFDANGTLMIEVRSEADYEEIQREIAANNEKVQQLWDAAFAESQLPENNIQASVPASRAYTVNTASTTVLMAILPPASASVDFSATYNTETNVSGATVIGAVYSINATAGNGESSVETLDSRYSLIDSARTIAANYSLNVGLRYTDVFGNEQTVYEPYSFYVEFYASGSSRVY